MTENPQPEGASETSFLTRIQENWKAITAILGIALGSIAAWDKIDSVKDTLVANDSDMLKRIEALEGNNPGMDGLAKLSDRLDRADEAFDARLGTVEGSMLKQADLGIYVVNDQLEQETCLQTMRAQMHEYRALEKAYDELLQTVSISEFALAGRPLSDPEKDQRDRVVVLRAAFEERKLKMEEDALIIQSRINQKEGC